MIWIFYVAKGKYYKGDFSYHDHVPRPRIWRQNEVITTIDECRLALKETRSPGTGYMLYNPGYGNPLVKLSAPNSPPGCHCEVSTSKYNYHCWFNTITNVSAISNLLAAFNNVCRKGEEQTNTFIL